MPVPRLELDDTGVMIIDVQDRVMSTIVDGPRVLDNASVLLKIAVFLDVPYLVTELDTSRQGRTADDVAGSMSDPSSRIERSNVSAYVDLVRETLNTWQRPNLLIAGVEAHIAVLQTVLDLLQAGLPCFLCRDAISATPMEQIEPAFRRMERAGAQVVDVRSAVLELLGDVHHPRYDDCVMLLGECSH